MTPLAVVAYSVIYLPLMASANALMDGCRNRQDDGSPMCCFGTDLNCRVAMNPLPWDLYCDCFSDCLNVTGITNCCHDFVDVCGPILHLTDDKQVTSILSSTKTSTTTTTLTTPTTDFPKTYAIESVTTVDNSAVSILFVSSAKFLLLQLGAKLIIN